MTINFFPQTSTPRHSPEMAGSRVAPPEPHRGQVSMEPQYHPSQEKILRGKKARHRRSGSHGSSSLTPRDSPNRDRRSASHGEDRVLGRLCEQETQTELPPSYPYFAPHGCEVPMSGSDVETSPRAAFCSRSIAESLQNTNKMQSIKSVFLQNCCGSKELSKS